MTTPAQDQQSIESRRKEIEEFWWFIGRMAIVTGGLVIVLSQAFFPQLRDFTIQIIGAAMLGPMVSAGVAQMIRAFRHGHDAGSYDE